MGWLKKRFLTSLEAEGHFSDATKSITASTGAQTDFSLDVISDLFTKYCTERCGLDIDEDFIHHAVCAMQTLKEAGRVNVIYQPKRSVSTEE